MTTETAKYRLELTREIIEKLVAAFADDDLYAQIVAEQAGEPLDRCLIQEWHDMWPVVDSDLILTGKSTEGGSEWSVVYGDMAMIRTSDVPADWTIDGDYAHPPE